MKFQTYDHPNSAAPCLHVTDEAGRTILELCKLTKSHWTPEPQLGYEVWSYTENEDAPLGTVTYNATEEPEPWQFVPDRWCRAEVVWGASMPDVLAEPWAIALEQINAEEVQPDDQL